MASEPFSDNQAWVTYIYPLVRVIPDHKIEEITLEQINKNTYDNRYLCQVVATLPLSESAPLGTLICGDGAIAIPRTARFQSQDNAMEYLNKMLCALLLGGVRTEAVDRRDIVWGQLHESWAIWPVEYGQSFNAAVHGQLRMRTASVTDTIRLLNAPSITIPMLKAAFEQGHRILEALSMLTPTFLLRGFTEIRYHNWSDALSNLWVCVEQLTSILWKQCFLSQDEYHPSGLKSRINSLKDDNRTWSTGVKQELLWQLDVIQEQDFVALFPARKARNDLVHMGKVPQSEIVEALQSAVLNLIGVASSVNDFGLRKLVVSADPESGSLRRPVGRFDDWEKLSNSL